MKLYFEIVDKDRKRKVQPHGRRKPEMLLKWESGVGFYTENWAGAGIGASSLEQAMESISMIDSDKEIVRALWCNGKEFQDDIRLVIRRESEG